MLLVIVKMILIFRINSYLLIHKFQSFVKLLQMVHQLIYHKIGQSGWFLSRLLGPLLNTGYQPARDVLGTSPEGLPNVLTSAISRGFLGHQHKNWWFNSITNVTGLVEPTESGSVWEKFELHLTSTCLLELLAVENLRETNTSIFISHLWLFVH